MSVPLLWCHRLTKNYAGHAALTDFELKVLPGEVVGLLGANGAGKTTAVRCISGLAKPTAGEVWVDGISMNDRPTQARARLGLLTSTTGVYERLTPRELLSAFGQLYRVESGALRERIDALSREFDFQRVLDTRCGALSSGQRQRISLARALVHDPAVYILDEPTANVDPLASQWILETVQRASERQRGVVFCTHRMDEAEHVCTRIVFLHEGRIVVEGSVREVVRQSTQPSLAGAFLHFARGASR